MLNEKNLRILQEYTENPRISGQKLAHKLNLSKNAVIERIKNLKSKEIIKEGTIMLNYFKLGFSQYVIFIKSITPFKNPNFIKKLNLDNVLEIVSLYGEYNLYFKIIVKNENKKNQILNSILQNIDVEKYKINELEAYDLIPAKKYFQNEKELIRDYSFSSKAESIFNFDKLDLEIIKELSIDSSISFAKIAFKLKQSPQLIVYRFKRLIKEKIILRLYGITDLFKFNLQLHFLHFELKEKEKSKELFKFLIQQKEIQDVSIINEKVNFMCVLETLDRHKTIDFIKMILNSKYNIRSFHLDLFAEQYYHNFFPKILENLS